MYTDLRYAIRMLLKNPGFTVVAVLTVALGIGANTAIFSVVDAILFEPMAYPEPERLVRLWQMNARTGSGRMGFSTPDFRELCQQNQVFEQASGYCFRQFNLVGDDRPQRVAGLTVSANLFELLGVGPALGRTFDRDQETFGNHRLAVLSHRFWQRRLGAVTKVIGKTISLDGELFTVAGVMPAGFQFPNPDVELWTPMAFAPGDNMDTRNNYFVNVIARLRPNTSREQALANIQSIAQRLEQDVPESKGVGMTLDSYHNSVVGSVRQMLLVLLGAVGFVLLIACANVANLLLARAASRQREISVRMALGATRARLLRQLLTESLVLAAVGAALGIALAHVGLGALTALSAQGGLPRTEGIRIDGRVLGFSLALCVITGLIFGLAPALQGSAAGLKTRAGQDPRPVRIRNLLVTAEVALSLMLLVGAGLMIRSFQRLRQVDPGFRPENLLTFQVLLPPLKYPPPHKPAQFFQELVANVKRVPGAHAVGAATSLPLADMGWGKRLSVEGHPPAVSLEQVSGVQHRQVSADYFAAMGIPVRKGRAFTERDDQNAPPVIIVNEAMVRRFLPAEDPIGKRIWLGPPERLIANLLPPGYRFPRLTIVGVVQDVRGQSIGQEPRPEVFIPHVQGGDETSGGMFVAVRTAGDPQALLPAVRAEVLALDKQQPIAGVRTMVQRVNQSLARPRSTMLQLATFAVLALVMAAIGLYGVIAYSVSQRTQEIGIRMALGAQRKDVLQMVLRQGARMIAAGLALGLAGSLALGRLISTLLFGIKATDWPTYLAVALTLVLVALLAAYVPARRAASVDPMEALRYE